MVTGWLLVVIGSVGLVGWAISLAYGLLGYGWFGWLWVVIGMLVGLVGSAGSYKLQFGGPPAGVLKDTGGTKSVSCSAGKCVTLVFSHARRSIGFENLSF